MSIKHKHVLVISFSTIIIGVVLASTIVGYTLYVELKNNTFASRYADSIFGLTAEILKGDINISNMKATLGKDELFYGMPFVEGSLKNNTNKTVTSILMEVSFVKEDGSVVYKSRFYLIAQKGFAGSVSPSAVKHTRNILLPSESISFRHLLKKCPPEIISQFSSKKEFAKASAKNKIKLEYSIVGVTVL